jgi:hypothetical protein
VRRWRRAGNRQATATVLMAVWAAVGFGLQATSRTDKQHGDGELAAFRLSMEKLRKAAQAGKILEKLSETNPSLKSATQLTKQSGLLSIDETVSRINDHPQARNAIESSGLSTKNYVLTMFCFEQSTQALFLKDDAGERHYAPGVSKENVVFVKKHLRQINRLFSEYP